MGTVNYTETAADSEVEHLSRNVTYLYMTTCACDRRVQVAHLSRASRQKWIHSVSAESLQ